MILKRGGERRLRIKRYQRATGRTARVEGGNDWPARRKLGRTKGWDLFALRPHTGRSLYETMSSKQTEKLCDKDELTGTTPYNYVRRDKTRHRDTSRCGNSNIADQFIRVENAELSDTHDNFDSASLDWLRNPPQEAALASEFWSTPLG
jgi:hypothetical protein